MQAPELSLPDQLQVRLTIKSGDPLTACRDKLAPVDFLFQVTTGYGGLQGAVVEMFGRHLPNRLRKNGQADFRLIVFVYGPRLQRTTTRRRATAARVDERAPRIASFVREHAIDAGPATQRYMSVRQAMLPDEAPIQTPDDTTFRQLQWVDQQEVAMQPAQEEANRVGHRVSCRPVHI
ncbi:unnamed protein product [Phytophthora fragariaefolia]|uniref:Unnamed protein product n=1 Tax=Phytophthora fragariaefolia TaxID=1490495 RepID=A0A9W7CJI7_9STRA|nr:unnamed protein product [Phytophthora fragariaefolia]